AQTILRWLFVERGGSYLPRRIPAPNGDRFQALNAILDTNALRVVLQEAGIGKMMWVYPPDSINLPLRTWEISHDGPYRPFRIGPLHRERERREDGSSLAKKGRYAIGIVLEIFPTFASG